MTVYTKIVFIYLVYFIRKYSDQFLLFTDLFKRGRLLWQLFLSISIQQIFSVFKIARI